MKEMACFFTVQHACRRMEVVSQSSQVDQDQCKWMWRDESGWKEYDEETSRLLETAFQCGRRKVGLTSIWFKI